MRVIVTISGGLASAWCAHWAVENYPNEEVILYFNDTKWEHPDLYRFINDVSHQVGLPIINDSDGRSPEELFYVNRALANDRMPFCSRILKAKRLQEFYRDGDVIIFGIMPDEENRARRIVGVYQITAVKKRKWPRLEFPLITESITYEDLCSHFVHNKIEIPKLYKLGFQHNNCSGGCVRAGKKHWKLLYDQLPEVYFERERVEEAIRSYINKDVHFFKDETLGNFRRRIEQGELSPYYYKDVGTTPITECIGGCCNLGGFNE